LLLLVIHLVAHLVVYLISNLIVHLIVHLVSDLVSHLVAHLAILSWPLEGTTQAKSSHATRRLRRQTSEAGLQLGLQLASTSGRALSIGRLVVGQVGQRAQVEGAQRGQAQLERRVAVWVSISISISVSVSVLVLVRRATKGAILPAGTTASGLAIGRKWRRLELAVSAIVRPRELLAAVWGRLLLQLVGARAQPLETLRRLQLAPRRKGRPLVGPTSALGRP